MIVSVSGQMIVGFGLALLLNRQFPLKGLVTTLLLLPMMMSAAVVGLFWKLLYDPSLGHHQLRARPRRFRLAVELRRGALRRRDHRHLDVVAVRDAAVARRPVGGAEAPLRGGGDRPRRAWYTFTRITLPLVAPLLLIALIFRTMEAFKTFDLAYIMSSQPTTELISIRLYKMAFQEWQTGKSCALAYIVLIMVLAITNIYVKYLNKVKER